MAAKIAVPQPLMNIPLIRPSAIFKMEALIMKLKAPRVSIFTGSEKREMIGRIKTLRSPITILASRAVVRFGISNPSIILEVIRSSAADKNQVMRK